MGVTQDLCEFEGKYKAGPRRQASLSEVAAEISARRPVCADITWPGGGSHVMAIAGVLNDQILVLDPASGEPVISVASFPAQYSGGARLNGFTFTKAR